MFRFSVDGTRIREFKNSETIGVPFPKNQPMRIYSSLWNADNWATRGGLVKTDWTKAPFTASYRNFNTQACIWSSGASSCGSTSSASKDSARGSWLSQELDPTGQGRLKWVQKNYMIYKTAQMQNDFHRVYLQSATTLKEKTMQPLCNFSPLSVQF